MAKTSSPATRTALPFEIAFGWGFGTLGVAALYQGTNILVLNYMTNVMGIGAGIAGLLIAGSKLYDAFADPFFGAVSDNTKHRWGRRRPYLLIGGILLALGAVMLFGFPNIENPTVAIWYMAFALVFYATAYSVYNVPYIAMVAEITDDFNERTRLMSYRVQNVSIANILSNSLGPFIVAQFASPAAGHQALAGMLGVIVLISAFGCFYMTRNARFLERHEEVKYTFGQKVAFLAGNRPFIVLITCKLLGLMSLSMQAVFPFFFTKVMGLSFTDFGMYFLVYSVVMFFVTPLWVKLGKVIGKRNGFILSLLGAAAVMGTWSLAGSGEPFWLVMTRAVIYGFFGCGSLLMGQALLPDAMEYDRLRTGMKREGIYAGLYTTVEKVAGAFSAGFAGIFLGAMGYIASKPGEVVEQPPSAIMAIYISVAAIPVVINLISATMLVTLYDLTEERLRKLRAESAATA